MALDFPSNPTVGQTFNDYVWNGTAWAAQGSTNNVGTQIAALQLANATTNKSGLVPIVPPTIRVSGGSATANSLGAINFTSVTSLQLDNVFTSTYSNYFYVWRVIGSTVTDINAKLVSNGVADSSANYVHQFMSVSTATFTGVRDLAALSWGRFLYQGTSWGSGYGNIFSPKKIEPTQFIGHVVSGANDIRQSYGTMGLSNSYDGILLTTASGNFTGSLTVFGYND